MRHALLGFALLPLVLLLRLWHVWAAEDPCNIRATLFVTPPALRQEHQDFGLPLDIDCSNASSSSSSVAGGKFSVFDLGAQRVAGKLHVRLNGSQTPPLGVSSYGLEYLANCAQLQSLEIFNFVGMASPNMSCAGAALPHMLDVSLRHNELATLSGTSLQLLPHLVQLLLEGNSLKLLEHLDSCVNLQRLIIRQERQLALREASALTQLPELQQLELTRLKLVEAPVLEQITVQLKELIVQETHIEPPRVQLPQGSQKLLNLSLIQCDLIAFSLEADTLLRLNLSGNALRQLHVAGSSLLSLDLSENHLSTLNSSWFDQLPRLQDLHLQANHLKQLSLLQLLQLAPQSLQQLDISGNQLLFLEDSIKAGWDQTLRSLRIQIDDNPWSCQWLLNFTQAQPQLFRLFNYAKYISQINVNGLSCQPEVAQELEELNPKQKQPISQSHQPVRDAHYNVSSHTVLYGNPVQQSRSQRSEAIIIVFMLPLGIALLFLLLYLYLHCERLFHWSYYSAGLGCFGGTKATRQRFVDHIDIVRYPIANGSTGVEVESQLDGYETPLSGAASICNCAVHRQSTCSRLHHVTYESMPAELPYQLYTEIKDQVNGETGEADQTPSSTAPIYDHLSFDEEEKPLEV